MSKAGINAITTNTPKNILFGAGTIHKGLTYTPISYIRTPDDEINEKAVYYTRSGSSPNYVYTKVTEPKEINLSDYFEQSGGWNFTQSLMGATNGGSYIKIAPSVKKINVDGSCVNVKGLIKKIGESAEMTVNFTELSADVIKSAVMGKSADSDDDLCNLIKSKSDITEGDYFNSIAFVGKTLDDANIIVIMENAICTGGLGVKSENNNGMTVQLKFECCADDDDDCDTLPYKIYYPKDNR